MTTPAAEGLELSVSRHIAASADRLYSAFTTGLERWLARRGTLRFSPEVGAPFCFETAAPEGVPHYGRVLRLYPGRLVELAWVVTGRRGTEGAETVLTVVLSGDENGTHVTVEHRGFASQAACDDHRDRWREALAALDRATSRRRR